MIHKVLESYGSLTIIRILSRVFQFFLKTYLIRSVLDKQILGHMVQLDLIVTVSLHILKSCLKPAYQKVTHPEKSQKNILSGMNLMNLGVLVTASFSFIVCTFQIYHYHQLDPSKRLMNLNYCILFYGMAVVNQAFFQKYNVRNVLKYDYVRSAIIQMSSFLPKTAFIFIAAQTSMFQKYGILVFGFGYFIYTSLLFAISYWTSPAQYRNFRRVGIERQQREGQQCYYVDQRTKQSARQFLSLSVLKLGIQQFQKIALVALDVSSFSSVYTLISNLGSIIVRYIFAPLQQIVYNYFSRGDQKQSVRTLIVLVKSITLFSSLSLTYGYNFSEAFLGLLYGQKWVDSDSIKALQIYTVLLSVLGINGIMQVFMFAKGVKSLKLYKYISVLPTLVYILLSFYLIKQCQLGTGSFFLANSISMIMRIVISWNLEIKKHVGLKDFLTAIKPSNLFLLSLLLTSMLGNPQIPHLGIQRYNHYLKDMTVGAMLFLINLSVVIFQHRHTIVHKMKSMRKQPDKIQ